MVADRVHTLIALCREFGLTVSPSQTLALMEDLGDLDWTDRDLVQEAAVACLARDEAEAATVRRVFDAVFLDQELRRARRFVAPLQEQSGAPSGATSTPILRPPTRAARSTPEEPPSPSRQQSGPEPARLRAWEKPGPSRREDPSASQGGGGGLAHSGDSVQAFVRFVRQRAAWHAEPSGGSARGRGSALPPLPSRRGDRKPRSEQGASELSPGALARLAGHASEWVATGALEPSQLKDLAGLREEAIPFLKALESRLERNGHRGVELRRLQQALHQLALDLHQEGLITSTELAKALVGATRGTGMHRTLEDSRRDSQQVRLALRDLEVLRDVVMEVQDRQAELPALVSRLTAALRRMVAHRAADRTRSLDGRLEISHTLYSSLEYFGEPVELCMTERRREVDLLLFLDTSGSQLWWAGAGLLAAHALGRASGRLQAYTFASRILEAGRFVQRPAGFFQDLEAFGGASDYQRALEELLAAKRVRSSSTVLMVGDCRDNLGHWETRKRQGAHERVYPESAALMAELVRRARRVVVLNPEASGEWGTGDSAALHYRAAGAQVLSVTSPLDLANKLSQVLK